MAAVSVLVIDSDRADRELIQMYLVQRGWRVSGVRNGRTALDHVTAVAPELVLMGRQLPDVDAFDLCQRIRERSSVPIVIVAGVVSEEDVVRGLGAGADDYVARSIGIEELVARLEAVLRRSRVGSMARRPLLAFGDLSIDMNQRSVCVRGRDVALTPREYQLLYHLALNAGMVLRRDELIGCIWGGGAETRPESLLQTTVRRLRQKLEDMPSVPRYVLTSRGTGYMLAALPPVEVDPRTSNRHVTVR
jgi:DNA-binding response OmpR family regulator